jgi:hypothetical protein
VVVFDGIEQTFRGSDQISAPTWYLHKCQKQNLISADF